MVSCIFGNVFLGNTERFFRKCVSRKAHVFRTKTVFLEKYPSNMKIQTDFNFESQGPKEHQSGVSSEIKLYWAEDIFLSPYFEGAWSSNLRGCSVCVCMSACQVRYVGRQTVGPRILRVPTGTSRKKIAVRNIQKGFSEKAPFQAKFKRVSRKTPHDNPR